MSGWNHSSAHVHHGSRSRALSHLPCCRHCDHALTQAMEILFAEEVAGGAGGGVQRLSSGIQ